MLESPNSQSPFQTFPPECHPPYVTLPTSNSKLQSSYVIMRKLKNCLPPVVPGRKTFSFELCSICIQKCIGPFIISSFSFIARYIVCIWLYHNVIIKLFLVFLLLRIKLLWTFIYCSLCICSFISLVENNEEWGWVINFIKNVNWEF